MTEPQTEAGRAQLDRWNANLRRFPSLEGILTLAHILAIEAEARTQLRAELREAVTEAPLLVCFGASAGVTVAPSAVARLREYRAAVLALIDSPDGAP